jgi:hypothetical protein
MPRKFLFRFERGNLGKVRSVVQGVSEMKICASRPETGWKNWQVTVPVNTASALTTSGVSVFALRTEMLSMSRYSYFSNK